MSSFRAMVAGHMGVAEELPLVHTSRCEHLASIIRTHSLSPQPCSVFKESLVYLFYGRPSYRSSKGTMCGNDVSLCPVCFVFKPRTVSKDSRRVYPCDSGAVANNKFVPDILASDLDDLALDPLIDSARRLVDLLFVSNGNYILNKVVGSPSLASGSVEARFYQLLMRTGPSGYDDRKSAIEVQVARPISLTDQLLFVVLPREFLEDQNIREAIINIWNCDPVAYSTVNGDAPASYYGVVREAVFSRFREATRI